MNNVEISDFCSYQLKNYQVAKSSGKAVCWHVPEGQQCEDDSTVADQIWDEKKDVVRLQEDIVRLQKDIVRLRAGGQIGRCRTGGFVVFGHDWQFV